MLSTVSITGGAAYFGSGSVMHLQEWQLGDEAAITF
jgi:hypothetical protein